MPFATAAVVVLILAYLFYLTIVQVVSGPRKDSKSTLPVPPRAISGNRAWPVIGHTILFHKYGGDAAFLFPPDSREWRFLPWSRKLGDIFSIFVWGQWNVVVKGPERVQKVLLEGDLTDGWPYGAPPIALLGQTCPAILQDDKADVLRSLIQEPLSQAAVLQHAPVFAEVAQRCLHEIMEGKYDDHEGDSLNAVPTKDSVSSEDEARPAIKLEALRSYTLDLIYGPVLELDPDYRDVLSNASRLENWSTKSTSETGDRASKGEGGEKEGDGDDDEEEENAEVEASGLPDQELLLLWMDRLKDGLCDIKFTYGPQWMQIWRLNPYGRALHARKHLETVLARHIKDRAQYVPVHHEKGRSTRDPFNTALPLWRITEDYFYRGMDPVMGFRKKAKVQDDMRLRAMSENDVVPEMVKFGDSDTVTTAVGGRPRYRAQSEPDFSGPKPPPAIGSATTKPKTSILDQILRASDENGSGLSRVATTEVTLLLWMMMDAGHAWTSMALHLLAQHPDACFEIQLEIDSLERKFENRLFTPFVLGKMEKLDNLIHEAMRLCPAFMGGLKMVNKTVELDGVQIPKNTPVFLSNPNEQESFTIHCEMAKNPENMAISYPSVNFYGFLPLEGLEIPIMVLQTKIFLIVLLQKHCLTLPGRPQKFLERVKVKISQSFRHIRESTMEMHLLHLDRGHNTTGTSMRRSKSADHLHRMEMGLMKSTPPSTPREEIRSAPTSPLRARPNRSNGNMIGDIRKEERMFTRVPFPKPLRQVQIEPRSDQQVLTQPSL